jgi:hypothetical protein
VTIGLDTLAELRRTGRQPVRSTSTPTASSARFAVGASPRSTPTAATSAGRSRSAPRRTSPGPTSGPLQGLVCTVGGVDVDRVAAVAAACHDAGASRVIGCTYRKVRNGRDLLVQLIHQTDTEGVMTYAEVPA